MSDTVVNQAAFGETVESQQEVVQSHQGPGAELAAQRKARAWTIEQVASQLNLAPRQIQALEENNYAILPGMASVRGFIRAYAKILKIDAQPLMTMVANDITAAIEPLSIRRPLATPFSENSRLPSLGGARKPSKIMFVIVPAMILAAVAFTGYQMGWGLEFETFLKKMALSAPLATPGQDALAVKLPEAKSLVNPDSARYGSVSMATIPNTGAILPQPTGVSPVTIAASDLQAVGKDALILKIHGDSWIEIRQSGNNSANHENTSNKVLVSHLVKAGSNETFEVTEPVSVTIGNAADVEATLRGVSLDLKSNTKNNIARLNLK